MKKKCDYFTLTAGIMALIFGLIAIISGVIIPCFNCTEPVDAVIIRVDEQVTRDSDTGQTQITYTPVFEYTYHLQTYRSKMSMYTTTDKRCVGKKCLIKINPDNPQKMFYECQSVYSFIVCALFFFVFAVIMVLKAFNPPVRKKRTDWTRNIH